VIYQPNSFSPCPSRIVVPLVLYAPATGTPLGALRASWHPLTLASILKDIGRGQGISPDLFTSPPPAQDSPLLLHIIPYISRGSLMPNSYPLTTYHTSHIKSHLCKYGGVNASKQTCRFNSESAELGNQGRVVFNQGKQGSGNSMHHIY
jgi:hypothetical protein